MRTNTFRHKILSATFSATLSGFCLFAFTGAANASIAASTSNFEDAVTEFSEHCQPECLAPFRVETQNLQSQFLETSLKETFARIAFEQAQTWADTILEGDYYADGKNHLESVEALYKESLLIGYRIFYFERAWETVDCSFNPETRQGLETCTSGIIREASFVSPDFNDVMNDENNYATFLPERR